MIEVARAGGAGSRLEKAPALVSPAIQTKFPGRGSHLAPSGSSAGRNLSPSVRRAVAPAGERTCGPAPAPCFLFIRHRRNDLKVLVAERFAGKLPSKQPRSAEACGAEGAASHWCGPATLEAGPGQGAPERPTGKIFIEETDGGVHLGGWRKTMNLHLPGHWCRAWDAHVRRENIVARTLSSPCKPSPRPPASVFHRGLLEKTSGFQNPIYAALWLQAGEEQPG